MAERERIAALVAALLASGAALGGTVARAAEDGLPPVVMTAPNGDTLRFYGQLNWGILKFDDGIDSESYGLVDNASSQSRVGLTYTHTFGDWTFQNRNEIGYSPYSTGNASITHDSPNSDDFEFSNSNIRWLDFTFENATYGKFWIGQGSMASDGPQELDLSGTDLVAYASIGDSAAGQILRYADPSLSFEDSLSGVTVGSAFTDFNGPRRVRLRYDTPEFAHMVFAVAYGRNLLSDDSDIRDQDIADASLVYTNETDTFETTAGLSYYWQEDSYDTFGGSASGLHKPTGLNLTVAYGHASPDEGKDGQYYYAKLGLKRPYVSWGDTALSIDYYKGDDFYLSGAATSSDSKSWGIAMVQNIDRANTELYLTWRDFDYSDNVASYKDAQAVFGGFRFKF